MDIYEIAIPSYKRPELLKKTTLKLLGDLDNIKIFIRDDAELANYQKVIGDKYEFVITNSVGIKNTRNFIRNYYYKHDIDYKFVIFMDDDIKAISKLDNRKLKVVDNLNDFFLYCYATTVKQNLRFFGLCGFDNAFFMKEDISTNLKFIIGACCGLVAPKEKLILCDVGTMEDYQFTMEHFLQDGGVVRFNNYCITTKFNNPLGGICEDMGGIDARNADTKQSCEYLADKYPDMCKIKIKKNCNYDIQLNYRFKNFSG